MMTLFLLMLGAAIPEIEGGALFLAGICVGAVNIWLTVRGTRGAAADSPLAPQAAE